MNLDRFLGLASSEGARRHSSAKANLWSDWSARLCRRRPAIQFIYLAHANTAVLKQISDLTGQQGCTGGWWFNLFIRWLASHMTVLKLQSDWNAQIPLPGLRIVSIFTRPFSSWEVGSGHEAIILWCCVATLPGFMTFGETFTTKEVSQFVPLHCIAAVVTVVVLYWMHTDLLACPQTANCYTSSLWISLQRSWTWENVVASTVYHSEVGYSPFFPNIYSCEAVSYS